MFAASDPGTASSTNCSLRQRGELQAYDEPFVLSLGRFAIDHWTEPLLDRPKEQRSLWEMRLLAFLAAASRSGGNNDHLSTLWREVISLAGIARSFFSGGVERTGATMKIQVRSLAIAFAIVVPIAVTATAKSSAAPINGTSINAVVPAVTTDVRYQVRRGHPHPSYPGYPTYNSYWGYPTYSSYWGYPTYYSDYGAYSYGYYRPACAPGPRLGAFATAPWTDAASCPPY